MGKLDFKWIPKNVAIIGAGGIGSFFVRELHDLIMNDQIPLDIQFQIYDTDKVELKNIKYQNFQDNEVLKSKAKVIGDRYGFVGVNEKITDEKQLAEFDAFIVCVDNAKARKLVYDYAYSTGKFFIDMRAEGRQIAVITSQLNKDEAMATLPKIVSDKGGSCQLKYEFDAGIIQLGNRIVAVMGAQTFLNQVRGDKYNSKVIMRI